MDKFFGRLHYRLQWHHFQAFTLHVTMLCNANRSMHTYLKRSVLFAYMWDKYVARVAQEDAGADQQNGLGIANVLSWPIGFSSTAIYVLRWWIHKLIESS